MVQLQRRDILQQKKFTMVKIECCQNTQCRAYPVKRPGFTIGRRHGSRDSVKLQANVILGKLVSRHLCECYFDKYLLRKQVGTITVTVIVKPMQATLVHNGLFQKDNVPCHTKNIVQERFTEHDEALKVLTWSANYPDLKLIKHLHVFD